MSQRNSFAAALLPDEFPTSDHDTATSPDVVTSVDLNAEWRRFLICAVIMQFDYGKRDMSQTDLDTFEPLLNALIGDLYD